MGMLSRYLDVRVCVREFQLYDMDFSSINKYLFGNSYVPGIVLDIDYSKNRTWSLLITIIWGSRSLHR